MWFPPEYPKHQVVALKYILYSVNAAGLFSLPPKKQTFIYKIVYNIYFLFVISGVTVLTFFTAEDLFHRRENVDVAVNRGLILMGLILTLTRQNCMYRHSRRIEILVANVQFYHSVSCDGRMKRNNQRFVENEKKMLLGVKIFFGVGVVITCSFLLPLYMSRNLDGYELPSVNATVFGIKSMVHWILVYAWNMITLSFALWNVVSVDLFIVGMYSEAACRLEILGDVLQIIGNVPDSACNEDAVNGSPLNGRSAFHRLIKKSVVEHSDIIKSVEELNHVFYWILVVQSVSTAIMVAGCSFYGWVSILHGDLINFLTTIAYIFGITCETGFYCKIGDRITSGSLNIVEALWKSHWYTLAANERCCVLLIMTASKNHLSMAAGRIFRMDSENLRIVLSSAYSYFTVLRNIYK